MSADLMLGPKLSTRRVLASKTLKSIGTVKKTQKRAISIIKVRCAVILLILQQQLHYYLLQKSTEELLLQLLDNYYLSIGRGAQCAHLFICFQFSPNVRKTRTNSERIVPLFAGKKIHKILSHFLVYLRGLSQACLRFYYFCLFGF